MRLVVIGSCDGKVARSFGNRMSCSEPSGKPNSPEATSTALLEFAGHPPSVSGGWRWFCDHRQYRRLLVAQAAVQPGLQSRQQHHVGSRHGIKGRNMGFAQMRH